MPYEKHPLFLSPTDPNFSLWRYMDFTKFASLLSKMALYFPSARCLQRIDKWEGVYLQRELDNVYREMLEFYKQKGDAEPIKQANKFASQELAAEEFALDTNFISCWHLNTIESAAMWRLYLKGNEGIAIKTSISNFKTCFDEYKRSVFIGKVWYKDYLQDVYYKDGEFDPLGWNSFLPFIHKRNNYEYEQEYRAVVWVHSKDFFEEKTNEGIYVPVNLEQLIEKVYVAPQAPEWFFELVKNTLKLYVLNKELKRSEMDDETCKIKKS